MFSSDIQTPRGGFKNNGVEAEFSNTRRIGYQMKHYVEGLK